MRTKYLVSVPCGADGTLPGVDYTTDGVGSESIGRVRLRGVVARGRGPYAKKEWNTGIRMGLDDLVGPEQFQEGLGLLILGLDFKGSEKSPVGKGRPA